MFPKIRFNGRILGEDNKENNSMTNIVTHNYQGFAIAQKESSDYVSLTDMAKAAGKQVKHYLALDSTHEYLEALSQEVGIATSSLIRIVQGKGKIQGTWAHPEIAIDFASWCNVHFRIWANRVLRHQMESTTKIKSQLKAVNDEILALKLLAAQERLKKIRLRMSFKNTPEAIVELTPSIAAFCDGKKIVSIPEILHHLDPSYTPEIKNAYRRVYYVTKCLRQLNYKKNGARHRVFIDGENLRVYSWELKV